MASPVFSPRSVRAVRGSWFAALLLLLFAGSTLTSCGAGLITGIAANENGNSTAEVAPPGLSFNRLLPLVPPVGERRTVVVTNAQIPASAVVQVTISALGLDVAQDSPTIAGQGDSTAITFGLVTASIASVRSGSGGAGQSDVDGLLTVLVDGSPIVDPVPIVLAKQPQAELDPAAGEQTFLSPLGQSVQLLVRGLREVDEGALSMFIETRDPVRLTSEGDPDKLVRQCTNLRAVPTGNAGEAIVSANVPGHAFAEPATIVVRDVQSGQSSEVAVYYRPEIALALPRQGSTTGGNLVTLIGTALATYDFSVTPARLSFDTVQLSFNKGERTVELAREDFREELSALDRLVFRMPASPDGRPGQVDIVLGVGLGDVVAPVTASQVFLFANPDPFFGPRGAVLDQFPVGVTPIQIDEAPNADGQPDFAVLTEEAGTGFLQLLVAQENGMFLRFGSRRRIGDPEVAEERDPTALCSADFDGDGIPDLFVTNFGAAGAVHHLVLGQARPATPLGELLRFSGVGGMARCRAGDFDGDQLDDLLLVPGPGAAGVVRPEVWLSRPVAVGQPGFAAPITVPVRAMNYQAVEIADLDGDGHLDVAVVDGSQLELDVAYGRGDGTFDPAVELDFTVPNYTVDPGSPAVGLHALGNGPWQSLGLVLGGDNDGVGADPEAVVATLHQNAARVHDAPLASGVFGLGFDPLTSSVIANLDGARTPELEVVVGIRDQPVTGVISVAVFRFNGVKFEPVSGGVEVGDEQPRKVRSLHFGRAFPPTPSSPDGARAIFGIHESDVDGQTEQRLSTFLIFNVGNEPRLLPPDGGTHWDEPVVGLIGGNWGVQAVAGMDRVRDLAVARIGGVDLLENDGFGGFPIPGERLAVPGIVPSTVVRVPAPQGQIEGLAFFDNTSRLGFWRPYQDPVVLAWSGPIRAASPNPLLRTAQLTAGSRVRIGDVDGDGVADLVAFLEFEVSNGEDEGLLVLARGRAAPGAGELPFYEPSVVTLAHGRTTSFALGDFAPADESLPVQLELAMAVPEAALGNGLDGDHVRFYRYEAGATPAEDRLVRSASVGGPQVLLAGSKPTRVAADDFDNDGVTDLLVAAAGDSSLRLFRNTSLPASALGEDVDIAAFVEARASPRALTPGFPTTLQLGDVDGDGAIDAVVAVEGSSAGPPGTSVAFYLSTEPGVFGDARFVSPSRLGNRSAPMALGLGDYNRDGVLDLFIGWDTNLGFTDRNVRVLFGGAR
ncbi:MAG: VCBS repeat-containing protein [bacterium]|nr:VCBS repeat-containing protein [bacterium]